jgi:hypothetical protein
MNKEFETWWGDEGFKIVRKQSDFDKFSDSKETAEKAWEAARKEYHDADAYLDNVWD